MPRVVLVTGASRFLGVRVAGAVAADPSVERVIGVDLVAPSLSQRELLGRTEFVRADIRNPLLAKVLSQGQVDTVVHTALGTPPGSLGGRGATRDLNLVGTMQLLAACQKSDTVSRIVVKSTTGVYGGSRCAQAVFSERDDPSRPVRGALAGDAVDIESYARGLVRRRPDIAVCIARLAHVVGAQADNPLTRYLAGPVVPTPLGRDPRLQVLHEDDAVESLRHLAMSSRAGVVNVAASGVLLLSQAVRRTGRVRVAVPPPLLGAAGALVGNTAVVEVLAQDPVLFDVGRVVDTTVLRRDFGFTPRHTTGEAVEAFTAGHRMLTQPALHRLGVGSRVLREQVAGRLPLLGGS